MTLLCGVIVVIERILADDDVISDALGRATKLFKAELDLASSFTSIQLPEEVPQDLADGPAQSSDDQYTRE